MKGAFLKAVESVHEHVNMNLPNAIHPKFEIDEPSPNCWIMHYNSPRNLIDILIGHLYGASVYFKQEIQVVKLSENSVEIHFKNEPKTQPQIPHKTFCPLME